MILDSRYAKKKHRPFPYANVQTIDEQGAGGDGSPQHEVHGDWCLFPFGGRPPSSWGAFPASQKFSSFF